MGIKRVFKIIVAISVILFSVFCAGVFFMQEAILFHPTHLSSDFKFNFEAPYEEVWIDVEKDLRIHGLLFKADSTKGIIFYLHGNGGSVASWGTTAHVYTHLGYDVFFLDYRGYGKSEGEIKNEEQFFNDVRLAYEQVTTNYDEIMVLGYSVGTCAATWISSIKQPDLLVLNAPYYSINDLRRRIMPIVPNVLVKYDFETYRYLDALKSPLVIFHGTDDRTIPYDSSLKLKTHFKKEDQLITLKGVGHNGMDNEPLFLETLLLLLK